MATEANQYKQPKIEFLSQAPSFLRFFFSLEQELGELGYLL